MKKTFQSGIAPLMIVIAVVAVLAIGGGAYYASKNSSDESGTEEENMNEETGENTEARSSLRALLSVGRDVTCTFESENNTSGTVYITSAGEMRGDYMTGTTESHMIFKNDKAYMWSGTQGMVMSTSELDGGASGQAETQTNVDLDAEIEYDCKDWNVDRNKFEEPSNVTFVDFKTILQGSGNLNLGL